MSGTTEGSTAPLECFGLTGWSWLNPPAEFSPGADGLVLTADGDTDFWVRTHYGYEHDTGHALLRPVPEDFRLRVTFTAAYREQFDQAGLLLRVDDRNWIKTGIEYVDGVLQLSAVVTREVSDWSVIPLGRAAEPAPPVTVELHREGDTVTIRYADPDGDPVHLLRLAYFPPQAAAQAGPMAASPLGKGFTAHFTALHLTPRQA